MLNYVAKGTNCFPNATAVGAIDRYQRHEAFSYEHHT